MSEANEHFLLPLQGRKRATCLEPQRLNWVALGFLFRLRSCLWLKFSLKLLNQKGKKKKNQPKQIFICYKLSELQWSQNCCWAYSLGLGRDRVKLSSPGNQIAEGRPRSLWDESKVKALDILGISVPVAYVRRWGKWSSRVKCVSRGARGRKHFLTHASSSWAAVPGLSF